MDARRQSPQRAASPGDGSARSPSSGNYPSNRGSSTSPTEGHRHPRGQPHREDGSGGGEGQDRHPLRQQQPQQQRGGGRPATTSSLFDTTVLTSSNSTPSGDSGRHNRAMAHLLDSVASSSSSPPSSQTPPHGGGGVAIQRSTSNHTNHNSRSASAAAAAAAAGTARRSPAHAGKVGSSSEGEQHHRQRRPPPSQQHEASASVGRDTGSARRPRMAHLVDESEFTELLGETPTWSRTPPRAQQSTAPQQQQQQQQRSNRQLDDSSDVASPTTSMNAGDFSSVLDDSVAYSRDDAPASGVGASSLSGLHGSSDGYSKSNWASPSEVMQLRAMFQEVTARYQREHARLLAELTKAQKECAAYAQERARVQELQKAYTTGLAQCEKAKAQQAQWAEERALQQLQLEKMVVENQRLQLFIAKKQKLHRGTGPGEGATAVYVPTESQERIRAAVQGITTATASAAASVNKVSSLSPFPTSYGPTVSAAGGAALDASGRPATAPPMSATAPQPQERMSEAFGGFHYPPAEHANPALTGSDAAPVAAMTMPTRGGAAEGQGSPYTLVSSESTPPLQSSPFHFTPQRQPPPQQQQQQRRSTLDSGSVEGADHTQLPTAGPTSAAARPAAPAGGGRDVSPSTTDPSTSCLSLTPTPLHRDSITPPQQAPAPVTDNIVRAVKKKNATHPAEDRARAGGAQGRTGDDADEHEPRRSSSLATPSPSVSAAVTTPTSTTTTPSAGASQRAGDPLSRPFSSLSESSSSGSNTHVGAPRGGGASRQTLPESGAEDGGVRAGGNNNNNSDGDDDGNGAGGGGGGGTGSDFDPSYARGVTDISSSSGSHLSATAAAAITMGQLIDAQAQRDEQQQQRGLLMGQDEMSSSPLVTSGSLGGGRLSSTTRTGDTPHEERGDAAAAAATAVRPSVATTTTTTPSFLTSTAATYANGAAGSIASSTSGSTWSLQYIYHLPRTPAEALQEELRLIKEVHRLGEENKCLEARLHHLSALKAMDVDQREQRLAQVTQDNEEARRRAAQWELTASQLQSEVSTLTAQCADVAETLDRVLATSTAQQLLAQKRLIALEASSRAALAATREEALVKVAVLRRTWADQLQAQLQQQERQSAQTRVSGSELEERERLQQLVDTLRTDLHAARAAQVELRDRQHATETAAAARATQLENVLVSTHDELERLRHTNHSVALHVDELEAEVERLREAAVTREAYMRAMEERLRLATEQLATQEAQLVDASTWQARALGAEAELTTQRAFYEKELNVYKTAACNMQDRHHQEMEKAVHRYEKLVVRFEAVKLRLSAAVADGVQGNMWTSSPSTRQVDGTGRVQRTNKKSPTNTPENSPNPAATKAKGQPLEGTPQSNSGEAFIMPGDGAALQRPAKLACDSVQSLRTSVEATDRIVKSLNRTASSRP